MKYYLNSDGSRFPKINRSGFGGYIKDSSDNILIEYTQEITDNAQKHNYELWGLITGLELAIEMQIHDLVCRCDDKTLMKHVNASMADNANLEKVFGNKKPLVDKVLQLSQKFNTIEFQYIVREENKYSDFLSRKYTTLIERNFLEDYKKLKSKSSQYFIQQEIPPHSIYFHSDNLTIVPFEFNPFILSQTKNKKQKEFRRSIVDKFNDNWELITQYRDTLQGAELEAVHLKRYNHDDNNWDIIDSYMVGELNLNTAVDIFSLALRRIYQLDKSPWIYSDIEGLTDIFYQKKPLSKEIFPKFLEVSEYMKKFDNILYHRTPKTIEKKYREKYKKGLNTIEETVELIKQSTDLSKKNKFFGQLMSMMIKELGLKNINEEEKLRVKDELIKKYDISMSPESKKYKR